jgi:hypothetical protein
MPIYLYLTPKEARKNNFTATDAARTLVSAAPRLISVLRMTLNAAPEKVEMSLDQAGLSACATSAPPDM